MMNRRDFLKLAAGGPFTYYLPSVLKDVAERRIGIIADTHLGAFAESRAHFWPMLKQRPVDFWIVAGDVVQIDSGQWEQAKRWLDELGKPYYAVPGNHDLVYNTGSTIDNHYIGPAAVDGLENWQNTFGDMQFCFDTEISRFVGVNSLGWDDNRQSWLINQIATTTKRIILVQHHPLMWGDANWTDRWATQKLDLAINGIEMVLTGHTHHLGKNRIGHILQFSCPAISYVANQEIGYALNDLWPMSYPLRGWLEFVDTTPIQVEFFRSDGVGILV